MKPLLNIAVRAARSAGDTIAQYVNRLDTLTITEKNQNDFVTEVDRIAEDDIIQTIRRHHPDHAFLAEESGRHGDGDHVWIIDPLDGTTNFVHGFPVFAVSMAYQFRGRTELAVIYDPMRQELFTAIRGSGSQLEGRRIRVSKRPTLGGSLIGTGFPYRQNIEHLDAYVEMFRAITKEAAGIRRPGAAALDLAYVAAGRLDGFWEIGLKPWDTAAGALLITEAGGMIGELDGNPDYLASGNVLAGNPRVYAALISAFTPLLPASLKTAARV